MLGDVPTIQLPQLVTAVEVRPSTYNAVERTVEVVWATGQRSKRDPFPFDDPFMEELGMTSGEVDLRRLNAGAPVLDSHGEPTHLPTGQPGLRNQIGVIERAWIAGGLGLAVLRFGVRDEIAWIRDEVAAGTFRNLSMRYIVHRYLDTGEFDMGLQVRRAVFWEPHEISILPIPQDFGTEVRSLGGRSWAQGLPMARPPSYPCEITYAHLPTGTGPMTLPNAPSPGGPAPTSPPVAAVAAAAPAAAAPAPAAPGPPAQSAVQAQPPVTPAPAAAPAPAAGVAPAVAPAPGPAPAPAASAVAPAPVAGPAPAPTAGPAPAPVAPAPAYAAPPVVSVPPTDPNAVALAERARIAEIYRAAEILPEVGRQAFAQEHVNAGTTLDLFRAAILERLVGAPGQAPFTPQVVVTREGEADQFAGLEESILNRCDPEKHKVTERSRPYVGMPLMRVAEELLLLHGERIKSRTPRALASQALGFRAAMTDSDFPNLLANVANKILQDAYEMTPRTFREWSRRRTISDFKTVSSLILHGGSQLEKVPEDAEIKRGTISESKETWSLAEYAKIWALSRKALINDDLSAFDDLPRRFAAQAANLEATVVYALLIANAAMSDGFNLFDDTNHGNDTTATALNTAGVGVVRAKMQKQTDLDSNRITVIPRHLIVPPDLETAAAQMNAAIVVPSAEGTANIWRGTFSSIQTEPRLTSAVLWYIAADPNNAPGIEYGFLAGENGPMVETRDGWDVLGTEIRVVHSFGAGVVDHRGLQRVSTT